MLTKHTINYQNVEKSHNIKQDINVYLQRLERILSRIIDGCEDGFNGCSICESDYSVQFLDIAVCILYEDGIIDAEIHRQIMEKLYDGHRG